MTERDIVAELQGVFDGVFLEPVKVTRELSAREVDEWDSMMQISVVVATEAHFGIRFKLGEVETTETVGDFVDLIRKHLEPK